MTRVQWTDDMETMLERLREQEKKSFPEIATLMGLGTADVPRLKYQKLKKARAKGVAPKSGTAPPGRDITDRTNADGSRELTATTRDLQTVDALVAYMAVDLTVFEVDRTESRRWDVTIKDPVTGNPQTVTNYYLKVSLRRKKSQSLELIQKGLIADIRAEVRRGTPAGVRRQPTKKGEWLFEFSPFDLHVGKYTWDEETVTNYDSAIAGDLFSSALDFLLSRALKVSDGRLDRVLCVFGNDVSHVDSKRGETTAGTRMDVDTRYAMVYRRICAIHRRAIDVLRQVAPVDVKIIPGNHDELTSFHLGEVLAARYDGVKHVQIDNGANLRKYYEYGVNLFGFTHGDAEKVSELPLLMARERPEMWARCPSREWHIGHKHIAEKFSWREQDLISDKGVRVRRLTSLSAHDAWHTKHAYTDRRACEGFVFHRSAGFTDHLSCNVDHFSGKVLLP